MLLYIPSMANLKAAKKAIRSSKRKQKHNIFWKNRFKKATKALKEAIDSKKEKNVVEERYKLLQKYLDKAVKEKVIHKNRASRVKSKYAKRISAPQEDTKGTKSESTGPAKKPKKSARSK